MSTVSFAKVPGAGSSESVAPAAPANAELVPPVAGTPAATAASPAPAASSALITPPPRSVGFFSGGDDGGDDDRSDVKMPRLNLVQGMSAEDLKSIAPEGNFVFNKALLIPQPALIVVAGMSRKVYSEKPLKFGDKTRVFDTLEQVIEAGGTDNWRMSRENREGTSKLPWFVRMATAVILIKKWDGIKPEDEEYFKSVATDGTAFAAGVYTLKSTSFTSFYVPLKSANAQGVLTGGYYHRYVQLKAVKKTAFEPQVTILESTSEAVRALAKSLIS